MKQRKYLFAATAEPLQHSPRVDYASAILSDPRPKDLAILRLQLERDGLASAIRRFLFSQLTRTRTRLFLIQLGSR